MEVLTELSYIVVSCVTLICWDLIDFYAVLRSHEFLWTKPFGIYYIVRVFFSIVIMEIIFMLNLINIANRFVIAFLTPLLFPIILQNLIIEIGGEGINIRDVFSRFREAIIEGMQSRLKSKKVRIQTKLLNSSLSNDYLKQQCLFLAPSSVEFERLEKYLSQKDEDEARVGYIKELTRWSGIKHAKELLKGEK